MITTQPNDMILISSASLDKLIAERDVLAKDAGNATQKLAALAAELAEARARIETLLITYCDPAHARADKADARIRELEYRLRGAGIAVPTAKDDHGT